MAEYLKCIDCGKEYDRDAKIYNCECGDLLDFVPDFDDIDPTKLKQIFRERRLSNKPIDISGVWRYRELLPKYEEQDIVTWPEGNTYLIDAPRCAAYTGLTSGLKVKHQGLNPTGSFKDNGMTVAISQARHLGYRAVGCASTGNTAASMAAYAARAGMKAVVFIPEGQIAFGKLAQALEYGALTIQIDGDFDKAMELIMDISKGSNDLYLLNSINPYRLEGQKAIIFELLDQLDWNAPDRIVVPGGNLGNSSAFGLGLKQLYDLGFISKMPRLTIVQAIGASPLYKTITTSARQLIPVKEPHTLATAIKIGNPISWKKAERALQWTDGWCCVVNEQEIADAKAVLGLDGISAEPASATTIAGLKLLMAESELKGRQDNGVFIDLYDDVVCILTGSGLKDPDYTVNYHRDELFEHTEYAKGPKIRSTFANRPIRVRADQAEIRRVLESL